MEYVIRHSMFTPTLSTSHLSSVGVNVYYYVNVLRQVSSVICKYSEIAGGAVCLPFWLREESNLPQLTTKEKI